MILSVEIAHTFPAFSIDCRFETGPGVTALFGPSGSGKSSIINAIAGLLRTQSGLIRLGPDILQDNRRFVPAHQRRLGLVFQNARLFPHLDVAGNLDYGTRFSRGPAIAARDDVIALLALGPLLTRRPASLSGGEAQRVAIGRALLSGPRMLLMDEPLASLDGPRKAEILPYLERLKTEMGVPILYVSHALDEVARLADDIVLVAAGRVLRQGPVFDVLSDPEALPFIGVREAGAVLTATVMANADDGLSSLRVAAGKLEWPGVTAAPGTQLRLRILASDITLSLTQPEGLSETNCLPVTITEVHAGQGPGAAIGLDAAGDRLLARVTSRTVTRMGLRPGLGCFAILKALTVTRGAAGQGKLDPDAPD